MKPRPARSRLLHVVTHPMTARYLLRGQLEFMDRAGFDVAVACAPGGDVSVIEDREGVAVFPVDLRREIAPVSDLRALLQLVALLRRWRPDIVNASTPKAGLLGMLAARLAGVPVRIYLLRGLRGETATSLERGLLRTTERIASKCADEVIAVSPSLADLYVQSGLAPAEKIRVVGAGSSNGVAVERFASPDPAAVARLRRKLALPEGHRVIGFVGRFTRDKGIVELVEAFDRISSREADVRLLLVGRLERGDPVPTETVDRIRSHPAIVEADFLEEPAAAYPLMDLLAFPSHREGFPNVPLEAAAAALPVVGFRSTGTVDAVVDGETGTLVTVGDVEGLVAAMQAYLADDDLRRAHGRAGQRRASREFSPERIWTGVLAEYERLLTHAGRPLPVPEVRPVRSR